MTILERLEQASASVVTWAVSGLGAGGIWLVRRVLTNQKQIELLQSEIRHRDDQRKEDREVVKEVRSEVKALRSEVNTLFRNHHE